MNFVQWLYVSSHCFRVRTEEQGPQYGRQEPDREERDHMEHNPDSNGTVHCGKKNMCRECLASMIEKRSRDEVEGRFDGTNCRAAKVSGTQLDVRHSAELAPDDKSAPANVIVDDRA